MTFTEDQFRTLSAFESYFYTAVKANYSRHPGQAGLELIHSIFTSATGDKRRLNSSCQQCVYNLIKDCGDLYFKDKYFVTEITPEVLPTRKKIKVTSKKKEELSK